MKNKLIEAKPIITEKTEALFKHLSNYNRGDVVRHHEIERIMGCYRYEGHGPTVLSKVRRRLLNERSIVLIPEHGVGYKLATTNEQLHSCSRSRQERAARQFFRTEKETGVLKVSELSDHQQRNRSLIMSHARHQKLATRRLLREQKREANRERVPTIAQARQKSKTRGREPDEIFGDAS